MQIWTLLQGHLLQVKKHAKSQDRQMHDAAATSQFSPSTINF